MTAAGGGWSGLGMTPTGRVETDAIGTLWTEAKAKEEIVAVRYGMSDSGSNDQQETAASGDQIHETK